MTIVHSCHTQVLGMNRDKTTDSWGLVTWDKTLYCSQDIDTQRTCFTLKTCEDLKGEECLTQEIKEKRSGKCMLELIMYFCDKLQIRVLLTLFLKIYKISLFEFLMDRDIHILGLPWFFYFILRFSGLVVSMVLTMIVFSWQGILILFPQKLLRRI